MSAETEALLAAATAVRLNAHAPYSDFQVGAALRSASGAVYVGCNVENVAYPEGTCAEAGAIAAMVAAGVRPTKRCPLAWAMVGSKGTGRPGKVNVS